MDMDFAEWEKEISPKYMLQFVQKTSSDRKMRLFACACCRRFWSSLPDRRSRDFIEAVERFADCRENNGREADESVLAAYFAAEESAKESQDPIADALGGLVGVCTVYEYQGAMRGVTAEGAAKLMANVAPGEFATERGIQAELLRDIIGPIPFRQPFIDANLLRWHDGTIDKLAQGIYDERAFDRLPILGDALEDAGCQDHEMLVHCRSKGPHVLGCWVVDLILTLD